MGIENFAVLGNAVLSLALPTPASVLGSSKSSQKGQSPGMKREQELCYQRSEVLESGEKVTVRGASRLGGPGRPQVAVLRGLVSQVV